MTALRPYTENMLPLKTEKTTAKSKLIAVALDIDRTYHFLNKSTANSQRPLLSESGGGGGSCVGNEGAEVLPPTRPPLV